MEGTDIIYLHISIILSTSCRCRLLRRAGSAHQGPAVCQVWGVRYFSIYSSLVLIHLPNSTVSNIWIFWYCEVSSCTTLLMEGSTILSSKRRGQKLCLIHRYKLFHLWCSRKVRASVPAWWRAWSWPTSLRASPPDLTQVWNILWHHCIKTRTSKTYHNHTNKHHHLKSSGCCINR